MTDWQKPLKTYVSSWLAYQLERNNHNSSLSLQDITSLERFKQSLQKRLAKLLKVNVKVWPFRMQRSEEIEEVTYMLQFARLIEVKGDIYMEEQIVKRKSHIYRGQVITDEEVWLDEDKKKNGVNEQIQKLRATEDRFVYNRRAAVQYAERWWNDYNPAFRAFPNDCTNYVSQCLYAGGSPMHGSPHREKGWWYTGESWSYSWAVAHSMRWYLSSSLTGLTAVEKQDARELALGDVICYDFDGNGRWDHTTIVTSFDGNGEPLVNAHTANSRARYWTYEDSTAWTPNIQYKFFRIGSSM